MNTTLFVIFFLSFLANLHFYGCTDDDNDGVFEESGKYHLIPEAYNLAKSIFTKGRSNYNELKLKSQGAMDVFVNLVTIMNGEMAKELRGAIIKYYKIKYFRDFNHFIISMEEVRAIANHCLVHPLEKLKETSQQFKEMIKNFKDTREFSIVNKCRDELPDEVATAHCIIHQANLFNKTMQDNLLSIIEMKKNQHAQDVNASLFYVETCFSSFIPKFFEQLSIKAYTNSSLYLKVVNASVSDLRSVEWKDNETVIFNDKWRPVVDHFKVPDDRNSSSTESNATFSLSHIKSSVRTIPLLKSRIEEMKM